MTFPAPLAVPLSDYDLACAAMLLAQPAAADVPTCLNWIAALLDHIDCGYVDEDDRYY